MLEIPPMATWVTDLQHLVPEFVKDAPAPAKRRAAFTREVVEAATCRVWKEAWISAVPCVARVGRRLCRGRIRVVSSTLDSIEWCCTDCPETGATGHIGTPLPYICLCTLSCSGGSLSRLSYTLHKSWD